MSATAGKQGGQLLFGEVVDHENDPTQTGMVRVSWNTGAGITDQLKDEDRPWHSCLMPPTNPSLDQTGGPHSRLRKGSRVIGIPLDSSGQEILVIGSAPRVGKGGPDQNPTFDSDLPQSAKVAENGGESQPRHGDVNGIVTQDSIVKYAEDQGGFSDRPAKYADLPDSIGTVDHVIA